MGYYECDDMTRMFQDCKEFDQPLASWYLQLEYKEDIFKGYKLWKSLYKFIKKKKQKKT